MTISVGPPEASYDNGSATESIVDSRGSPLRGDSFVESILIPQHTKIVGGENVENSTFLTDARLPFLLLFSK